MKCKSVSLVLLAATLAGEPHAHAQLMSLGTAQTFAVLGGSAVTNTGPSVINGNLGVSPGLAITGFGPGVVTPPGTIYAGGPVAAQAQADLTTSYNVLAGLAPLQDLSGQDLGGLTLTPGVYKFTSSAQITGALTLNALGDPNALFVFQIGSTLTTASNASVLTTNSAVGCNVFFQVGSSAALGTGTAFQGNILALSSITANTGADILVGRALAREGAVTLDTNDITSAVCAPVSGAAGTFSSPTSGPGAVPEPGTWAALAGMASVGGLAFLRRRNR
jgi:type VI secretion system secreted protein VgrG